MAGGFTVLALIFAFAPRGYVRAALRSANGDGTGTLAVRYQFIAPGWMGKVQYPRWTTIAKTADVIVAAKGSPQDPSAAFLVKFIPVKPGDTFSAASVTRRIWFKAPAETQCIGGRANATSQISLNDVPIDHEHPEAVLKIMVNAASGPTWLPMSTHSHRKAEFQ